MSNVELSGCILNEGNAIRGCIYGTCNESNLMCDCQDGYMHDWSIGRFNNCAAPRALFLSIGIISIIINIINIAIFILFLTPDAVEVHSKVYKQGFIPLNSITVFLFEKVLTIAATLVFLFVDMETVSGFDGIYKSEIYFFVLILASTLLHNHSSFSILDASIRRHGFFFSKLLYPESLIKMNYFASSSLYAFAFALPLIAFVVGEKNGKSDLFNLMMSLFLIIYASSILVQTVLFRNISAKIKNSLAKIVDAKIKKNNHLTRMEKFSARKILYILNNFVLKAQFVTTFFAALLFIPIGVIGLLVGVIPLQYLAWIYLLFSRSFILPTMIYSVVDSPMAEFLSVVGLITKEEARKFTLDRKFEAKNVERLRAKAARRRRKDETEEQYKERRKREREKKHQQRKKRQEEILRKRERANMLQNFIPGAGKKKTKEEQIIQNLLSHLGSGGFVFFDQNAAANAQSNATTPGNQSRPSGLSKLKSNGSQTDIKAVLQAQLSGLTNPIGVSSRKLLFQTTKSNKQGNEQLKANPISPSNVEGEIKPTELGNGNVRTSLKKQSSVKDVKVENDPSSHNGSKRKVISLRLNGPLTIETNNGMQHRKSIEEMSKANVRIELDGSTSQTTTTTTTEPSKTVATASTAVGSSNNGPVILRPSIAGGKLEPEKREIIEENEFGALGGTHGETTIVTTRNLDVRDVDSLAVKLFGHETARNIFTLVQSQAFVALVLILSLGMSVLSILAYFGLISENLSLGLLVLIVPACFMIFAMSTNIVAVLLSSLDSWAMISLSIGVAVCLVTILLPGENVIIGIMLPLIFIFFFVLSDSLISITKLLKASFSLITTLFYWAIFIILQFDLAGPKAYSTITIPFSTKNVKADISVGQFATDWLLILLSIMTQKTYLEFRGRSSVRFSNITEPIKVSYLTFDEEEEEERVLEGKVQETTRNLRSISSLDESDGKPSLDSTSPSISIDVPKSSINDMSLNITLDDQQPVTSLNGSDRKSTISAKRRGTVSQLAKMRSGFLVTSATSDEKSESEKQDANQIKEDNIQDQEYIMKPCYVDEIILRESDMLIVSLAGSIEKAKPFVNFLRSLPVTILCTIAYLLIPISWIMIIVLSNNGSEYASLLVLPMILVIIKNNMLRSRSLISKLITRSEFISYAIQPLLWCVTTATVMGGARILFSAIVTLVVFDLKLTDADIFIDDVEEEMDEKQKVEEERKKREHEDDPDYIFKDKSKKLNKLFNSTLVGLLHVGLSSLFLLYDNPKFKLDDSISMNLVPGNFTEDHISSLNMFQVGAIYSITLALQVMYGETQRIRCRLVRELRDIRAPVTPRYVLFDEEEDDDFDALDMTSDGNETTNGSRSTRINRKTHSKKLANKEAAKSEGTQLVTSYIPQSSLEMTSFEELNEESNNSISLNKQKSVSVEALNQSNREEKERYQEDDDKNGQANIKVNIKA